MQVITSSIGSWKVDSCSVSTAWQGHPVLVEKQLRGSSLGFNSACRPLIRAKLQSSHSPKDQNGDVGPAAQFPFHPLFAHSLSFLKKFSCDQLPGQLHSPSVLSCYAQPRRKRRAIVSLFKHSGKWLRNSRDPKVSGKLLGSRRFYRVVSKLFRSSIWVAAILLVGGGLLYGQAKAQDYLDTNVIPSLAVMVGAHLQREVVLGRVAGLTPLGFRMGPSSVSTHGEEFSCGELPDVEIKIKPFASLQRGQLVVDAVLTGPSLLVAQKEDWSWLGIPSPAQKKFSRHSSEAGIDARTKSRRLAREQAAQRLGSGRNVAARRAAEQGYFVRECGRPVDQPVENGAGKAERPVGLLDKTFGKVHHLLDEKKRGRAIAFELDGVNERSQDVHTAAPAFAVNVDAAAAPPFDQRGRISTVARRGDAYNAGCLDDEKTRLVGSSRDQVGVQSVNVFLEDRDPVRKVEHLKSASDTTDFRENGAQDEASSTSFHGEGTSGSSLRAGRRWISGQVLRPVRRVLLKKWSQERFKPPSKADLQRKNLGHSAAAAKSFFERQVQGQHQKSVLHGEEDHPLVRRTRHEAGSVAGNPTVMQSLGQERRCADGVREHDSVYSDEENGNSFFVPIEQQLHGLGFMAKRILAQSERKIEEGWSPVALETVHFKDGNLMLLAYGDGEARVLEGVNGYLKLGSGYGRISAYITGRPKTWKTEAAGGDDGGKLMVKVEVDMMDQSWDVKVRGHHLFAPLLERLLEIPIDWSQGRATGEVHIWMGRHDNFPMFGGRVDVTGLDFQIWEAPSEFKGVGGTICFQGQRLFFHNASGHYGSVPLSVSGDFDLNPEDGEYRLSCQVSGVEVNALMRTLNAQPPPYPLAGTVKAVVYCRGPLDAPIFEGTAETVGNHIASTSNSSPTVATEAVKLDREKGAVAAYDRIAFSSAFASFTFNSDDCVADLYGIRATPVGGGEIRGAGTMWICPEGEVQADAVRIDCSGHFGADAMLRHYVPAGVDMPPLSFGPLQGEAKIRGSILMPTFDVKWETPKAQGSLEGAHGEISVTREAITINSSAFAFDLFTKIHTLYPPIGSRKSREFKPAVSPTIEGIDLDARFRGFDIMGLSPSSILPSSASPGGVHMKVTGKVKFQGRVPQTGATMLPSGSRERGNQPQSANVFTRLVGDVTMSGVKLNQLLIAPHLVGSLDISPRSFELLSAGRVDEHLNIQVAEGPQTADDTRGQSPESPKEGVSLSLQRGQLHMGLTYRPQQSAKLEIRNLPLDELEIASLRGAVPKAYMALNLQKRRGQGSLSVRRPRCSGLQGESLDVAARWSGDVVTLEKSVLEQANSRYELQGEYVLPRPRTAADKGREDDRNWEKAMGGQLGSFISAMGRWRLRLDVPRAEVSEMLPVARLLSRSSDPAVVSRSKELFLQGVQKAGFSADDLKQQLEYIRRNKVSAAPEDLAPESMPLPGLAELKGQWHGSLEATGGGNGDTTADFDLRGEDWEWGTYKTQKVIAIGDYSNNDGLRLENFFIQKDAATLHADGTLLGPKPNLHFAVLNFPIGLVPPLLHAFQAAPEPLPTAAPRSLYTPLKGILYMEGDLRGHLAKPQCDVQIRLLDGAVGGVSLGRAEVAASITSASRLAFNAVLEPATHAGHVRVRGSLPMGLGGTEEHEEEKDQEIQTEKHRRGRGRGRERIRDREEEDGPDKREVREKGGDEGWEVRLAESLKALDVDFLETGAVQVDAAVKDGGMMLLTAMSPGLHWLQGNADITLKVRGTVNQPVADGVAAFQKVAISSPVLPRPLTNLGGIISVKNNQLCVEGLEGRVGRRGHLQVKGKLPFRNAEYPGFDDAIEVKAESLEVRARNAFSGQVDSQIRLMGSLVEPEVNGVIKLSHGEAYLSQEKGAPSPVLAVASNPIALGVGHDEDVSENDHRAQLPIAVRLRALKLQLGPELRMVYPLILNFAVSGELELNGFADAQRIKPRGTLTFENGDVNLVATQVRLNRDHPNRAKFEPEQGLDPSLDLALVGADWQLKVQGRARNWQDNLVITSTRSGEQDAFTRIEAARVFESQLAESLLEGDGQLAFKKLAAATVETLMPKIEGKGEFGQARWRLVSAPQIPNLLSLDPTTDPFKSLANLSFGTEVEVQLGKHLQASVVRQLKESEMATQWTLLYQLNSKLRLLFSSIPSVDNRILFEYSATSQN